MATLLMLIPRALCMFLEETDITCHSTISIWSSLQAFDYLYYYNLRFTLFSFCWNSHSIQCFLLIIHSNNSVLLIYSLVFRKSLLFINFLTTVEFFAHHLSLHIVVIVLRIRALLFGFGSHLSGLSERCFPSIRLAHGLIRIRNVDNSVFSYLFNKWCFKNFLT